MITKLITPLAFLLALGVQAQTPNIVGYEYWFDQNDAARIAVQVPPAPVVELTNAALNTTGLSLGQHVAHLRWKDVANGETRWSSVVSRALQVGQPGPWEITAVRYWWSNTANPQPGTDMRYLYFDPPQAVISYTGLLDLCDYPTGAQTLKLQLRDNHGQWSSVVTRPVQINASGVLGLPSIAASSSAFCPGDVVTFTATPQTGASFATPTGYTWQTPTGNGWSAAASTNNTITITIGNVAGTIEASATNYCGSSATATFPVNIAPTPAQPTIDGPLQACIGSTSTYSTPQVPGLTYEWTVSGDWVPNGGTGSSFQTTVGVTDATINVTPYNACGVAGPPLVAAIEVSAPPNAGSDAILAICSNDPPVDLFNALLGDPQTGGTWSGPSATTGLYIPASMEPGTYVYTVNGTGGCAPASASVQVSEPQLPNAGTDASLTLCSNAAPEAMLPTLGGSPEPGGIWTGPSPTTGTFDPATMSAGNYTYTVLGTIPCPSASATLSVTVEQGPNAGVSGTIAFCTNEAPQALLSVLGGELDINGLWTGPNGAFSGIFIPAQDPAGVYTYTVPGMGQCEDASATVTVSVIALQLTSIDGPTTIAQVEPLTFTAAPFLADADSFSWEIPSGWNWAVPDSTSGTALLIPPAQAGSDTLCVTAYGGQCTGNTICLVTDITVGSLDPEGTYTFSLLSYPNPNNGSFTVRATGIAEPMVVRVLNALGQEVTAFNLGLGNPSQELEQFSSGTYVLQWMSGTKQGTQRIVVSR